MSERRKNLSGIALFLPFLIILYFTLITREPLSGRVTLFQPFQSYMRIVRGEYSLIKEELLNIALFIYSEND